MTIIHIQHQFENCNPSSLDVQAQLNIEIYEALKKVDPDKAERFGRCGEEMYVMECQCCGYKHVVRMHCKLRVCPKCSAKKMVIWVNKYEKALKEMVKGGKKLRFITLTLKNQEDLRGGVEKIVKCFKRLRRRKYYRGRIDGGLYAVEATVGRDGKWNVHMHVLIVGEEWGYIEHRRLADDWEELTGDSRVVWIERVGAVRGALRYLLKYVAKGVEFDEVERVIEFVMALEGVRLIQAFGILMGKVDRDQVFCCPVCGGCVWVIKRIDTGEVIVDELARLRRRARAP